MSRLLFRLLVALYPRAVRRDYGAAMLETLDERLAERLARPIRQRRLVFVMRESGRVARRCCAAVGRCAIARYSPQPGLTVPQG